MALVDQPGADRLAGELGPPDGEVVPRGLLEPPDGVSIARSIRVLALDTVSSVREHTTFSVALQISA
jgi:hypothetical protein